jgi:HSP20 family protein
MLMRTDPFRALDQLSQALWGTRSPTSAPTSLLPMTAYRDEGTFVVQLDLPGVDPASIDVTVEQNVLTVHAERKAAAGEGAELLIDERDNGVLGRQLVLEDTLDVDRLSAAYDDGVLTIQVPILEPARPRKIEIATTPEPRALSA